MLMQPELRQLAAYLDETLGATLVAKPWDGRRRLVAFLREQYGYWDARLLNKPCLLMLDKADQERAAGVVCKHVAQVQEKWPEDVVYVRGRLTPYNRKRLLEHKVPFIVPASQMYLPMLGMDFRERSRRAGRSEKLPLAFRPATQAVVLYWLLNPTGEYLTPREMGRRLGYSPMTMTRAFDQLKNAQLGEITRHGKERRLRFVEPKCTVWAKAQPLLQSPVTKRVLVPQPARACQAPRSGLAALAHYSMLAPPAQPVVAVYGQDWKSLPLWHNKIPLPRQDPDALEVEVWNYRPDMLLDKGVDVVDPLSLYLSLRDDQDERVQAALEKMIAELKW
ncbi:MAG: hypothetical protein LLG03_17880 [Planctomycetaceae bacterium]|nr:hypothetical protein [Planctomycetaceae bacterium]